MDESYIGTIVLWGVPRFVPQGWFACQGQQLPVQQYAALFSLIGNAYGGDGVQNFNLPDLRGAVPVGIGVSPYSGTTYNFGQKGGKEIGVLAMNNLPPHQHPFSGSANVTLNSATLKASSQQAASHQPTPQFNTLAAPYDMLNSNEVAGYNSDTPDVEVNMGFSGQGTAVISGNTGNTGGAQPFNIMQPYVGLNYIICWNGIYPQQP